MALSKQVEVQREAAPHNCCSENSPQRTTRPPFVAAAASLCWDSRQLLQMPSFSFADQKCYLKGVTAGVLCMIERACVCVCVMVAGGALLGLQSTQLDFSFLYWAEQDRAGGARGRRETELYLSPRMAYWLSSCKCCMEAPVFSSRPRFLCFTTSKVFSISLSLKPNQELDKRHKLVERTALTGRGLTCVSPHAWRWTAGRGTVRRWRSQGGPGWGLVYWE